MSTPSPAQIRQQIRTRLYVRWNALRRNHGYRTAVRTFPEEVRALQAQLSHQRHALGEPPPHDRPHEFQAYIDDWMRCGRRMQACQTVLETCERLAQRLGSTLTPEECNALKAMQGRAYEKLHMNVLRLLGPCMSSDISEAVPPLAVFQQQWGIKFPLDPEIPYVIKLLLSSSVESPIQWNVDDTGCELSRTMQLSLTIYLDSPKKLIMSNIEEIVSHVLLTAPGQSRRLSEN
jgi:hypothetical protein